MRLFKQIREDDNRFFNTLMYVSFAFLVVYLLSSPTTYMSLGVGWYDITNIFNDQYDRTQLGFSVSQSDPNPIFQVMNIVSAIAFTLYIATFLTAIFCLVRTRRHK